MAITALHIPYGDEAVAAVSVNERNAMSYYPFVSGGPVEGGYLTIQGWEFVVYVNSRYTGFDESTVNERASALFEMAGVGVAGGAVRGDALVVLSAQDGEYEQSLPEELISARRQ